MNDGFIKIAYQNYKILDAQEIERIDEQVDAEKTSDTKERSQKKRGDNDVGDERKRERERMGDL